MILRGKILIVDDDAALRRTLAGQLELHEEFSIAEAETAGAALESLRNHSFDAILLDVGLPDMDGRDLCRLIRRSNVRVPILMLAGAESDADTILGLESGASDYITKPFRLNVLLARLRAQLRQCEQSDDPVFTIGPYTFRPSAKLLVDATRSKKVRLTAKETDLIRYLYRARDRIAARDMILSEVWRHNAGVMTHTVETHIYRLRKKMEIDPAHPEIIVRESGGYRLVL